MHQANDVAPIAPRKVQIAKGAFHSQEKKSLINPQTVGAGEPVPIYREIVL